MINFPFVLHTPSQPLVSSFPSPFPTLAPSWGVCIGLDELVLFQCWFLCGGILGHISGSVLSPDFPPLWFLDLSVYFWVCTHPILIIIFPKISTLAAPTPDHSPPQWTLWNYVPWSVSWGFPGVHIPKRVSETKPTTSFLSLFFLGDSAGSK